MVSFKKLGKKSCSFWYLKTQRHESCIKFKSQKSWTLHTAFGLKFEMRFKITRNKIPIRTACVPDWQDIRRRKINAPYGKCDTRDSCVLCNCLNELAIVSVLSRVLSNFPLFLIFFWTIFKWKISFSLQISEILSHPFHKSAEKATEEPCYNFLFKYSACCY